MSRTINIWSGEAEAYDAYRPQSPPIIMDVLIKDVAHRVIGSEPIPWYLSYRMRIGIK